MLEHVITKQIRIWGPDSAGLLFAGLAIPGILIGPLAGWVRDRVGARTHSHARTCNNQTDQDTAVAEQRDPEAPGAGLDFLSTLPSHIQERFEWGPDSAGLLFAGLAIPGILIGPLDQTDQDTAVAEQRDPEAPGAGLDFLI
jgi:hypothetical protein